VANIHPNYFDHLPVQTFISELEKDNREVSTTEYIEKLQQILNYTHNHARKQLKESNEYKKKHYDQGAKYGEDYTILGRFAIQNFYLEYSCSGVPNLLTNSFTKAVATFFASWFGIGRTSVHYETICSRVCEKM
jgi:hypothetical protein